MIWNLRIVRNIVGDTGYWFAIRPPAGEIQSIYL